MGEGFEEELVTVQPLTRGTGNDMNQLYHLAEALVVEVDNQ